MKFGYLGINYRNASLAVRDHISFSENVKIDFMQKAEAFHVNQTLILATCNRNEIFFFFDEDEQFDSMKQLYIDTFREVDLSKLLLEMQGEEALAYLFRIASGLESAVLGEDQILGQLKDAMVLSNALGFCKKEMHRVVENALATAKAIKTKYRVSEIPLSVSYIGIKEVEKSIGFDGKRVLFVGSGATAVLALKYVSLYETKSITVCSRNSQHAKAVKDEFPMIDTVLYEERYEKMAESDIVISATSSPHYAIEAEYVKVNGPILFLDLAAPRDVDPKLLNLDGVTIINLDLLDEISKENQKERERLMELCRGKIDEAVKETTDWLFSSRVDATISSLNQRCDEITEESFSYLNRKLSLSAREQKILKKILKASLKKLIREPILELKSLDSAKTQEEYTKMLSNMFHLEEQEEANEKKAIIVTSFGTLHEETRAKTIDMIETEFRDRFGEENVFTAWTSEFLAKKCNRPMLSDAFESAKKKGFKQIVIAPTHLMKGKEYEKILAEVDAVKEQFEQITVRNPLLADDASIAWMAEFLMTKYRDASGLPEDSNLILVGHGSSHEENRIYTMLQKKICESGCQNILIGTVEGTPDLAAIVEEAKKRQMTKVVLAPFLFVAGTHAKNDLCGDNPDSWYSVLLANGIDVTKSMVALGEFVEIRNRYLSLL